MPRSVESQDELVSDYRKFINNRGPMPLVEAAQPDISNLPRPSLRFCESYGTIPGKVLNTPNPVIPRVSHRVLPPRRGLA